MSNSGDGVNREEMKLLADRLGCYADNFDGDHTEQVVNDLRSASAALRASAAPEEGTLVPGDTITVRIPEGYETAWDFLNDCGLEAVYPTALSPDSRTAEPATLRGMIAAIYGKLDAEDCAMIDREWAKQRGYILPTNGTAALALATEDGTVSQPSAEGKAGA